MQFNYSTLLGGELTVLYIGCFLHAEFHLHRYSFLPAYRHLLPSRTSKLHRSGINEQINVVYLPFPASLIVQLLYTSVLSTWDTIHYISWLWNECTPELMELRPDVLLYPSWIRMLVMC